MIRTEHNGISWYSFESLRDPAIVQGTFTRHGGVSQAPFGTLNVGSTVGDDPAAVQANHARLFSAWNIPAERVVTVQQVHGNRVAVASEQDGGRIFPETDALISQIPGLYLLLRFADCVPVFLYAPRQRAVGLTHAGWKGTLQEIAMQTVRAMTATFGCQPGELVAGIGPSIGPCCLEMDGDVLADFRARYGQEEGCIVRPQANGKAFVDLWRINALQLQAAGVQQIETAGICTSCRRDEFFSHRAENGKTGRFAALIGITAKA
ncbi:MAG: peptidoglycan editing factor PgeF [Chloroflexi bacterium]|jgi:YfiH family protein|nr:peptidoglycan editing factor PgeF [Chloroflexota bacterium]